MKVSIAIPVYEMRGSGIYFLKENLERIASQTFKDIEVVISDHSVGEEIRDLCEEYSKRIRICYFKNEEKRGNSSYNMNFAISRCTGDIVKFMMQDEYLFDVEAISKIRDSFLDEKINWCVTSCYYGEEIDSIKGRVDPYYNKDIFSGNNTIGSPSVVSVRNKEMKYFDEDLIWLMDCDYYVRMYKDYGDPFVIKDPLIFVTQHKDQITSWISQETKDREGFILRDKYSLDK
jgi:glycosyltransferase involved in cell wall biosynthesis